jgi:cardiolipin synthase
MTTDHPTVTAAPFAAEDISVLAERAYSRTSGADAIHGNAVRLLIDAGENYPAWLEAIRGAQRSILFEMYIVDDDDIGQEFAEALAERARAGVTVKVLVDWLGGRRGKSAWRALEGSGAEMRLFNAPGFTSPLAWLTRDHRKTITIDDRIGFVSGLCVSRQWQGDPAKRLEPWRDTGIAVEGPAVAALQRAFALVWDVAGESLDPCFLCDAEKIPKAGDVTLRVVAGMPNGPGTYRLDLTIASVARSYLWLTDAYFVGTSAYVGALAAAARDGVDVRLLVPGASDIPMISPVSRAAYKPLLEAGVRVFEWNGTMMHAKCAVADGVWSRVGSTNLNLSTEFIEGEGQLLRCDVNGIALASGSSCVSKSLKISHVLAAIGLDHALAQGNVIMTLGKDNTDDDIDYVIETFSKVVATLRGMSPMWDEFEKGMIDSVIHPRGRGKSFGEHASDTVQKRAS